MRTEDFHKLLEDPKHVADYLVDDLRDLARKYPYSQLIQLMYGLRLRTSSEHLFNQQLGKTAVLTNDRSVLFELFENRNPSLNKGIETVEVESVSSPPVLAELSEAPIADTEVVQEQEKPLESSAKEEKPAEEPIQPEETQEEKVSVEPLAQVEVTPIPKKELPSALPENMAELSPQERVKAILERNRQLREQFESQKSGGEAKLFDQDKTSAPEPPIKEEVKEEPIAPKATDEAELVERDSEALTENETEIPETSEVEKPSEAQEELQEPVSEVEEDSSESLDSGIDTVDAEPDEAPDPSAAIEVEEREPWADSPIDIEALIRRRFARRFESIEESEEEEVEWDEEEDSDSLKTVSSEEILDEEIKETEAAPAIEPESTEEEAAESSISRELSPEEAKSDLALASRIRMIRDRLETLRNSDALSREELEVLMEEHRQLEALMADLPLDEEQLFEVEIKLPKTGDTQAEESDSTETSPEISEEQTDSETDKTEEKPVSTEAESETPSEAPTETKSEEESPEQEIDAPKEAPVAEEVQDPGEDLDSEIRRIEQLAEKMRSGSKDDDSDSMSELREQRMNELIEERKKSLEAALAKKEEEASEESEEPGEETQEVSKQVEEPQAPKPEMEEEPAESKESVEAGEESSSETGLAGEEEEARQDLPAEVEAETGTETKESEESNVETGPEIETPAEARGPSFSQWLKRIAKGEIHMEPGQPIAEEKEEAAGEDEATDKEPKEEISKKIDLLDSFVEKLPELKKQSREAGPASPKPIKVERPEEREEDQGSGLVTETLAKVYIRQKHYKKAIQAYEILMLKYPEKSSFFASQISEIKKLANSK
ncbi:hypothetical protein [Croceimicrobium sp.]|uniref:hypothetical protein n=1 Tax=Croceimicrobium sp. TaxID=2828340 RepID=UPI003BA8CFC3